MVQAGEPEVHRQRGKWVVRQSGYDPATGKRFEEGRGRGFDLEAAQAGHLDLVDHIGRCRRLLVDAEKAIERVRGDDEATAERHRVKLPGADS